MWTWTTFIALLIEAFDASDSPLILLRVKDHQFKTGNHSDLLSALPAISQTQVRGKSVG